MRKYGVKIKPKRSSKLRGYWNEEIAEIARLLETGTSEAVLLLLNDTIIEVSEHRLLELKLKSSENIDFIIVETIG